MFQFYDYVFCSTGKINIGISASISRSSSPTNAHRTDESRSGDNSRATETERVSLNNRNYLSNFDAVFFLLFNSSVPRFGLILIWPASIAFAFINLNFAFRHRSNQLQFCYFFCFSSCQQSMDERSTVDETESSANCVTVGGQKCNKIISSSYSSPDFF